MASLHTVIKSFLSEYLPIDLINIVLDYTPPYKTTCVYSILSNQDVRFSLSPLTSQYPNTHSDHPEHCVIQTVDGSKDSDVREKEDNLDLVKLSNAKYTIPEIKVFLDARKLSKKGNKIGTHNYKL